MGWTQDYHVESVEDLLERLTGKTALQLLKEEVERQGLKILKTEEILLDEDIYSGDIRGEIVHLSDGRVFVPKLTERFTSNGNYGSDSYRYVLQDETPEVKFVNEEENVEFENHGC